MSGWQGGLSGLLQPRYVHSAAKMWWGSPTWGAARVSSNASAWWVVLPLRNGATASKGSWQETAPSLQSRWVSSLNESICPWREVTCILRWGAFMDRKECAHTLREPELVRGMWGDLVLLQLQSRACLLQPAVCWDMKMAPGHVFLYQGNTGAWNPGGP